MTDLTFDVLRPDYESDWSKSAQPNFLTQPHETLKEAAAITEPAARARFAEVERRTGVPWFVSGIIITREAGSPPNFHAWMHNGDPMRDHLGHARQTVNVPRGRPPNPDCTWEDGAVDAYEVEHLVGKKDWTPAYVAWLLEKFNGFGYRVQHNMASPYVWGATIIQQRGKYTHDRVFDPTVMDTQVGGMALLAALMRIAPDEVKFT